MSWSEAAAAKTAVESWRPRTRHSTSSTLGQNVSVVIIDGGDGPYVFARKDDAMAYFKELVLADCEDPSSIREDFWDDHEHTYWTETVVIRIWHTTLILDDNREES